MTAAQQREWRERHPDYMQTYYRAHKERWQDYAQSARQPGARERASTRPCRVEGCPEPRHVYPAGYVDARCRRHEAEQSRARYWARRGQSPPIGRPLRPCWQAGCSEPRWIRPNGARDEGCQEHSYTLEWLRRRLAGTGLSLEHYGELIMAQDRCCAACGKRRPGAVLEWRYDRERDALTCSRCRHLIEYLRRSAETAAAIAAYLAPTN